MCLPHGCPCGYRGDTRHECHCTERQIQNYRRRISGPLMDRIDIQVDVPHVAYRDLASRRSGEPSAELRKSVVQARQQQIERYAGEGFYTNSRMENRHVEEFCRVESDGQTLLRQAVDALGLSARAYNKVLKIARTIADLAGSESIRSEHVSEAINYRSLDRALE